MWSGSLLRSLRVSRSSISPLVWRWSLAVFPPINRRHRSSLAGLFIIVGGGFFIVGQTLTICIISGRPQEGAALGVVSYSQAE